MLLKYIICEDKWIQHKSAVYSCSFSWPAFPCANLNHKVFFIVFIITLRFCTCQIYSVPLLQMSLQQKTLQWGWGFSQQCWNTSKHPGGPKMLCQIKLNQWIPLQDPPHFQTDPGPVRSPLPAQSQKHAQDDWGYGNKPSLTHGGFNNNNKWMRVLCPFN